MVRVLSMTKSKASKATPDPEAPHGTELPLAPSKVEDEADLPPHPPEPDPLAKWRAAREMEEEMADIFDEDRVTHQHGDAEPEAD
jgi:hypothetical protein